MNHTKFKLNKTAQIPHFKPIN